MGLLCFIGYENDRNSAPKSWENTLERHKIGIEFASFIWDVFINLKEKSAFH